MPALLMLAWLACTGAPAPSAPNPAPVTAPSPVDRPAVAAGSRADVIYFVMIDRFADGLPDRPDVVDRSDPQAWHGGDLPGLIAKLDYLDELGVGAVWISPITVGREDRIGEWGAFHNYWLWEPTAVLGRFGETRDLVALREGLHARGMKLYLDVVYNHVGYDAPLLAVQPGWFNGRGDVKDWQDPEQVVRHDVHGLPDLRQELPEVRAWLRDSSMHWIRTVQPDGFRVDAVRHLEPGFLAEVTPVFKQAAGPSFGMLGEVLDGDPRALQARLESDALDAVFDFPLHFALRDSLCGNKPLTRLASTFSLDATYKRPIVPGPTGLAPLVTLLDNHDLPRVWSQCGGDVQRVASALAVLIASRGTPSLTWGTEIGLEGAEEPANRADMDWSNERRAHPLFETTKRLIGLRARWPVLQTGGTHLDRLDDEVLAFTRFQPDSAVHVVINRADVAAPIALPPYLSNGDLVETITVIDGGLDYRLTDRVPPRSVALVRVRPAQGGFDAPPTDLVDLVINAVDVAAPDGATVRFVGAGETLGAWEPSQAPARGADGRIRVQAPRGTTLTGKLVIVHADGRAEWEPREDRALLLGAGRCGERCVRSSEGDATVRWFWGR